MGGKHWLKVAKIQNNRNHITTGSNTNKLSDAEINKLRSKGTGKMWLQCGDTTVFLDEKAKPFNALASGKSMIRKCSAKVDGPFKEAAPKHSAHRSIDCWDMGIKVMYQHLGVNGCWNAKGNGKTGALLWNVRRHEVSCSDIVVNPTHGPVNTGNWISVSKIIVVFQPTIKSPCRDEFLHRFEPYSTIFE